MKCMHAMKKERSDQLLIHTSFDIGEVWHMQRLIPGFSLHSSDLDYEATRLAYVNMKICQKL